jgi:hypothetical protein
MTMTHRFQVGEKVRYKGGWGGEKYEVGEVVRLYETDHALGGPWIKVKFWHGYLTTSEDEFLSMEG